MKNFQTYFFIASLILVGVLVFFMFIPFLSALILSITLAIIFNPLFGRVLKFSLGSRSIASLLTILIILIIFLIPITFFGVRVFNQAHSIYVQLSTDDTETNTLRQLSTSFENAVNAISPNTRLVIDIKEISDQFFRWVVSNIGSIFSSIARIFTMFLLSLLALYYLFKDGLRFKEKLFKLSPLPIKHNEKIFFKLKLAVNSVIRGYLIISSTQVLLAGVGFEIFGLPNAAFWGLTTMVAALVPIFGTSLVLLPAVLYLYLTGNTAAAIGLLIWALTAVGLIDNFLGPRLIGRSANIHPLFILMAVLGGVALFGPVGFLIGPISLALLFALLEIYPIVVLGKIEDGNEMGS
ncbi:MAG: AI-2E family transporter [bacterium]|nr:AI-2E family transporter [bacterium]